MAFYKWMRKANFYQKIEITKSTEEIVQLIYEITTSNFTVHVCNIFWQYSELKYLKRNIGTDEAILSDDFFAIMKTNNDMKCKLPILAMKHLLCSQLHVT